VVWVLVAIVSYGVDRPPVINKIQVDPPRVALGSFAAVKIQAEDPDGGRLTYECVAESGRCQVADARKPEARYSPGTGGSGVDRITVTVTDPHGLVSTGSQFVIIEGAVASAEGGDVAKSQVNHPPILKGGGGPLYPNGDNPIRLEATGSDPDGDNIDFKWDFGSCLVSAPNPQLYRAEVRLSPGCESGSATLTWTDAHGATASAEWTIHR
jgi:Bacterial Ig domain